MKVCRWMGSVTSVVGDVEEMRWSRAERWSKVDVRIEVEQKGGRCT